jgi:hypothetical protein
LVNLPAAGTALNIKGAVFNTIGKYPKAVVGTFAGVGFVLLAGVAVYGVFEFTAYQPARPRKRSKLK